MQMFTGLQYLMMDIASSFGLDKANWSERLAWFEAHKKYHEFATTPEMLAWVKKAEEPAQALAGIYAYRATVANQPIGYMCGLDATASGLQLLALLAGCEQSASICNLINTGRREDAYTAVYESVCNRVGANQIILRKAVKNALMTHLYGSTAVPKAVFGEGTPELGAFYAAIDEMLPGANMLNYDLLSLWQSDALAHQWTLPDGFDVVIKVMDAVTHHVNFLGNNYEVIQKINQPKEMGLSMGANIIHSIDGLVVREMNRRCNYTVETVKYLNDMEFCIGGRSIARQLDIQLLRLLACYDATGFMSAAIFEVLDNDNFGHLDTTQRNALEELLYTLPENPFPVVCIHDCFKFHPNYGNDVRIQYKQILAELAASDILSNIASQITGRPINVNKLSSKLPQKILESEYAIC
jgi:Mitochondrial DNA-directed RNA polymerase